MENRFRNKYDGFAKRKRIWTCSKCKLQHQEKTKVCNECGSNDIVYFDSRVEAVRWAELKLMQDNNRITNLTVHPKYPININGIHICNYLADFFYFKDGKKHVEDVKPKSDKGQTDIFKLKKKLVEALYKLTITIIPR